MSPSRTYDEVGSTRESLLIGIVVQLLLLVQMSGILERRAPVRNIVLLRVMNIRCTAVPLIGPRVCPG